MGDHDALFKRIFSVPANAAEMLACILPAGVVAALDLSRLELLSGESISDQLSELRADLLFRAPLRALGDDGEERHVYLPLHMLVEHQSTPPQRMPLRGLRYALPVWLRAIRDDPWRRLLPPVIVLVIYHGPNGWTGPRSLHEMVDGMDQRVLLEAPDEAMSFLSYISLTSTERHHHEVRRVILEHIPAAEEPLASIAEQLKLEGRLEGRQEGRREGRQEAMSNMLRRLVQKRFGALSPAHEALIAVATPDELERAIERAALAPDLDSVFQKH